MLMKYRGKSGWLENKSSSHALSEFSVPSVKGEHWAGLSEVPSKVEFHDVK